jgi:hypothetical protein
LVKKLYPAQVLFTVELMANAFAHWMRPFFSNAW